MRIQGRVFNTPLAISPDKAAVIAQFLLAENSNETPVETPPSEPRNTDGTNANSKLDVFGGIAQINVSGMLVEKSSWLDAECGLVGYDTLARQFEAAEGDARVKGVLLVIDSPGGEVSGMFECARVLSSLTKPIFASVNFLACSAGYLLAAQAEQIFITDSSLTGSVGVIAQHMEVSGRDAERGIKYTTIYAGARKNDGNPHEPLSNGAQQAIKDDVDDVMNQFVAFVAQSRGISEEQVRGTEAAIFRGQRAIGAGLADRIGSPEDALAALTEQIEVGATETAARRNHSRTTASESAPARMLTGAQCKRLAALCLAAGQAERLPDFIEQRATEEQVVKALSDPSSAANPGKSRLVVDAARRAEMAARNGRLT